ncbi:CLUMA_CG006488, isoform A [Clunio marinus]|uniref:Conserved oligomeric Golgi complex subunit 1 n=1 Tax=Clunio marinus TaxID=568069 RepID=A0A1J1I3I7_9DIPT|nr:CLUMA_CG006488, isoform A [Clunio marinus]
MLESKDFLNLDVDKLFEQHTIKEIEGVNRKIQSEIENKREELRTMVGERYRELIQAADTIAEMKKTSFDLSANITKLSLQNQEHLMGFKTESEEHEKSKASNTNNIYGVVVQIKILTLLPELIWSRIDDDDFFVATQLFIFSRHISTGLKLDVNNEIMKKFPVAKKEWDLLAPFFYTIRQQCLQTLERENLTSEIASKCLASLLLLENCQLEKLLTTFVQTRLNAFTKAIEAEDYDVVVKEKLLKSLKILISTITIVHDCFIRCNDSEGLLNQELKKIIAENSQPTLSLLEHQKTPIFQTLPDIIAKYKPQVFFSELSQESLQSTIQNWLKSVENISQKQLKSLIQLVVSIKTIQDIQQQVMKTVEKPKNWKIICKNLSLRDNIDFFRSFYQSLINDRIQNIINIFWSDIIEEVNLEVEKLITDNDRVHRDLKHYVWLEDPTDNPLSLQDALSTNKSLHKLLMKVKGFTTAIVDLCNKIDGRLELLFTDLKIYLGGRLNAAEIRRSKENVDPDHKEIVLYLRECSKENISTLITTIKSSKFNRTAENCITIARLLQSISELCPNLQLCFTGQLLVDSSSLSYLRDPTKLDDGEKEWNNVCVLLEEESIRFWRLWMEMFVGEWKPLDHKFDLIIMLRDFPSWDTITIEEKDESDNIIQSQIHIPSQLSISVQCWIHEIIVNLNKIIPHTLPKSIHMQIVDTVVDKLHEHYQVISTNDFTIENQKAAWQFFLDVKVLMMLFVARENKAMNDKFQVLTNHFKSIIDPFDFDVFYQYVNGNIKRNAARMQHGFGLLVPNMEHLNNILTNHNVTSVHDKDPNILVMCSTSSNIPWFPLLPIITKDTLTVDDIVKKDEKKITERTTPGNTSNKKQPIHISSSTSALSSLQDWFR